MLRVGVLIVEERVGVLRVGLAVVVLDGVLLVGVVALLGVVFMPLLREGVVFIPELLLVEAGLLLFTALLREPCVAVEPL